MISTSLNAMRADLATAQDEQITRVVALVDAMAQRGVADDLIAPLRPRLQALRPKRPFGLTRLMLTPLDSLIVPGDRWQRGGIMLPRTALGQIGLALRAAMPNVGSLESQALLLDASDHDAVATAGRTVWPLAAAACKEHVPAATWRDENGLAKQDFALAFFLVGVVLDVAADIESAAAESPGDSQDAGIRVVLRRAASRGPIGFGAAVTILLFRLASTERVIACAAEIAGSADFRLATDQAIDATLDTVGVALGGIATNGVGPSLDIPRLAALLDGLEPCCALRPERLKRLESIRRDAGQACRRAFQHVASTGLLRRIGVLPANPADQDVAELEASARDLRRIEASGRRFGADEGSEALLKSCRALFRSGKLPQLTLADRARMLEIMGAPDEAMALLAGATP